MKLIKIIIIFLFTFNYLKAQDIGSFGGNFIKIPVAPIPASLAQSYTAMIGPDSILYNPGALGLLSYNSASLSHNVYLEGINQEYGSFIFYTKKINIGAFFNILNSGKIKMYGENDNYLGTTSSSHKYYGFSLSKSWPRYEKDKKKADLMLIRNSWTQIPFVKEYRPKVYRFSLGSSIKFIDEKLDTEKSKTLLMDFGALLVLPNHWQLGASLQNIGGKQKFVYQTDNVPYSYRLGLAKDLATKKDLMIFTFLLDTVKYQDYSNIINLGMQVDILKSFQFRIGYSSKKDEGSKVSGGFGMNFDKLTSKESFFKGIRMDYALVDYGILGFTHRIGFQLIW